MDWITVLLIAAAAQCLLLCGVVLAFPGGNHQANRYLATFLLASALTLTLRLAIHANLSIPALVMALFSLVVFKGPLLFYYVRRLSDPEFRFPLPPPTHRATVAVAQSRICLAGGFWWRWLFPIRQSLSRRNEQRRTTVGLFYYSGRTVFYSSIVA